MISARAIGNAYPLNQSSDFFSVNLVDASLTELSSTIKNSGYFFSDITFGPDGLLYASNIADAPGESLITLDLNNSKILSILHYEGPSINYGSSHAIAFAPNGDLYLMNQSRLSKVNTTTGETIYLADYSNHFKSISFSPDGDLFGLAITSSSAVPDELWKIALEDFSLSFRGLSHGSIDTMRFGPNGILYGVTNNSYPDARVLINIDPADGSYTSIGSLGGYGHEISGLAIRMVPEPTTLALIGLGLFGIGWKRRKMSHIA